MLWAENDDVFCRLSFLAAAARRKVETRNLSAVQICVQANSLSADLAGDRAFCFRHPVPEGHLAAEESGSLGWGTTFLGYRGAVCLPLLFPLGLVVSLDRLELWIGGQNYMVKEVLVAGGEFLPASISGWRPSRRRCYGLVVPRALQYQLGLLPSLPAMSVEFQTSSVEIFLQYTETLFTRFDQSCGSSLPRYRLPLMPSHRQESSTNHSACLLDLYFAAAFLFS